MADQSDSRRFIPLGIAVLTVSDTRRIADDRSGDTLSQRLTEAGHRLAARAIVPDEIPAIRAQVEAWLREPAVDVQHGEQDDGAGEGGERPGDEQAGAQAGTDGCGTQHVGRHSGAVGLVQAQPRTLPVTFP